MSFKIRASGFDALKISIQEIQPVIYSSTEETRQCSLFNILGFLPIEKNGTRVFGNTLYKKQDGSISILSKFKAAEITFHGIFFKHRECYSKLTECINKLNIRFDGKIRLNRVDAEVSVYEPKGMNSIIFFSEKTVVEIKRESRFICGKFFDLRFLEKGRHLLGLATNYIGNPNSQNMRIYSIAAELRKYHKPDDFKYSYFREIFSDELDSSFKIELRNINRGNLTNKFLPMLLTHNYEKLYKEMMLSYFNYYKLTSIKGIENRKWRYMRNKLCKHTPHNFINFQKNLKIE